jgi:hypothetical protein
MATSQNIINSILSPKVVSDGNNGYTVKTDIVNVDRINYSTTQCGSVVISGSSIDIPNTSASSIVIVTPTTSDVTSYYVATNGTKKTLHGPIGTYNYFIAKF